MPFRNRLTGTLGIEHPVLLAPMDYVAGGRLAAAVSQAGGLGLIGGGYGDGSWLGRAFDAAGNARVGCGFITWSLAKQPDEGETAMSAIEQGKVDLVINIPREYDQLGRPDGYLIRRRAVDANIPLITDLQLARAVIGAMRAKRIDDLRTLAYDEYIARSPVALR